MKSKTNHKGVILPFLIVVSFYCFFSMACKHGLVVPEIPAIPVGPDIPAEGICFQENILPILQSNCALSGCHDAITGEEDLVLTNYSNLMSSGIVNSGDPAKSKLYQVITTSPSSEQFMPPSPHLPLTLDQIALIYWWISDGALDNPCPSACDSNIFTFSGAVLPTVQSQCMGCHSGGSPSASLVLDNYTNILDAVNNKNLYSRITTSTNPMPPTGLMSDCKIKQIKKWIDAGKLNN